MKVIADSDTDEYSYNTFLDDISYSKCNKIVSVNDGIVMVNKSGEYINYYTNRSTIVYNLEFNDSNRGNIYIGNVDDITEDDKMFIVLKEGIANEIFVWKAE